VVDDLLPAKSHSGNSRAREMSDSGPDGALIRAMPAVFVLIWSTGFIVAKFGLPYAPALTFLVIRYLLSIACFLVWIGLTRAAWPRGARQWAHLGVTGILMHAGYLGGVWVAVKGGMGSGLVALIVGLQPVLTALWVSTVNSSLRPGAAQSRVTARQWLGLSLGLGGLLLVVARKFGTGSEVTVLTLGCSVLALLSITAGTLYQKRFVQPADVRTANAIQLLAAFVVTLPLSFLEHEVIVWNGYFLSAMAWSVMGLTLGGSSLLYLLIQRGAATAVTSLLYLVPPTTALMAWALFGESITLVTVAGTALTALGVSLVVRPAKKSGP
jgi:drug/metabolite transporter (DMT)-like permease